MTCTPGARFAIAALGLALVAGCAPTFNWRTVAVTEDLDALFPCRVERRARSDVALGNRRVAMDQTACRTDGLTFAISRAVAADPAQAQELVGAWVEAAGANLGARAVERGVRTIRSARPAPGTTGPTARRLSIEGRLPDGASARHELLVFTRGTMLVQVSVLGVSPARDAVETFFDGVEVKP